MKTQPIWLSINTFTLILDGTVHHNLIIRWLCFAARQPTLRSSTSTRGSSWATPTPPWTASGGSNSTAPPNKVQLLALQDSLVPHVQRRIATSWLQHLIFTGLLPETWSESLRECFREFFMVNGPLPESWCDLWKIYTLSLFSDILGFFQSSSVWDGVHNRQNSGGASQAFQVTVRLGNNSLNHHHRQYQLTYHSFQEKAYV